MLFLVKFPKALQNGECVVLSKGSCSMIRPNIPDYVTLGKYQKSRKDMIIASWKSNKSTYLLDYTVHQPSSAKFRKFPKVLLSIFRLNYRH